MIPIYTAGKTKQTMKWSWEFGEDRGKYFGKFGKTNKSPTSLLSDDTDVDFGQDQASNESESKHIHGEGQNDSFVDTIDVSESREESHDNDTQSNAGETEKFRLEREKDELLVCWWFRESKSLVDFCWSSKTCFKINEINGWGIDFYATVCCQHADQQELSSNIFTCHFGKERLSKN